MEPEEISLQVTRDQAHQRLDLFVRGALSRSDGTDDPGFSNTEETLPTSPTRSRIRRWIDEGCVTINGRREKAGYLLRERDVVLVVPPPPDPTHLEPEDIPLRIFFEDEDLLVVDKPAGLVVHPGTGHHSGTLANALLYHLRKVSRSETIRPGIVHRLDKDTSGLLVVAKNDEIHLALSSLFKNREVEKLYLALVYGTLDPKKGRIDKPLGRAYRHRTKMSTRSRHPRDALTEYQTLREFTDFSLLQVRLHTGRTHQIRVHFEDIGHPVVGDATYAANRRLPTKPASRTAAAELSRQFLHATSLEFRHPRTGAVISVESPLPAELEDFLTRL